MTKGRRLIWQTLLCGLISGLCSAAVAQEPVAGYRSRAEYIAEQRKAEQAYPDLVRALRALQLPPDIKAEAKTKLKQHELNTRATRQQLQLLDQENERQGYDRSTLRSAAADELRASLQQSDDQLHSEIKNLLTPQQRDQFERRLQQQNRPKPDRSRSSHSLNR